MAASKTSGWTERKGVWYAPGVPLWVQDEIARVVAAFPACRPREVRWNAERKLLPEHDGRALLGTSGPASMGFGYCVTLYKHETDDDLRTTIAHELAHSLVRGHGFDHIIWTARIAGLLFRRPLPAELAAPALPWWRRFCLAVRAIKQEQQA